MADTETIKTDNAETASPVQPETGAETTAPAQTGPQDVKPEETPDNNELAKWKAMSRKNEKQAEANLKQMQQVQAELAQARADNARLTVKNTYPQITDDVLALCSETEPDKITAWAQKYANLNPIDTGKPAPKPVSDPRARESLVLAENPQGVYNPKPKAGDAYQRSQDRQNARRRHRNQTNK